MKQILEGVCHCHENRIIHRDLKPANILLSGATNDRIKIADFGLARAFSIPIKPYTKDVVTLYYRAPELLLKMQEYSTGVDIWSVGCIFAELATRKPIFTGQNDQLQLNEIFKVLGTPTDSLWPNVESNQYYKTFKLQMHEPYPLRNMISK